MDELLESRAGRFFWGVTTYPKTLLVLGLAMIISGAAFLPRLGKDTSAEAFMPRDHPSVVFTEKVEEIFGLLGR